MYHMEHSSHSVGIWGTPSLYSAVLKSGEVLCFKDQNKENDVFSERKHVDDWIRGSFSLQCFNQLKLYTIVFRAFFFFLRLSLSMAGIGLAEGSASWGSVTLQNCLCHNFTVTVEKSLWLLEAGLTNGQLGGRWCGVVACTKWLNSLSCQRLWFWGGGCVPFVF